MIIWQALILAVQIMLLAAGWQLYQTARGELSARAAEAPVLTEIRALKQSIEDLLAEIEATMGRHTASLDSRKQEAALLLDELHSALESAQQKLTMLQGGAAVAAQSRIEGVTAAVAQRAPEVDAVQPQRAAPLDPTDSDPVDAAAQRRAEVFRLADAGWSARTIAQTTQMSEGEIETLLGLRRALNAPERADTASIP